jgi:hypothetical protein
MQPHNFHCSSLCYVVESPCWARVWVRMRVQQRLHLVPAAGGYLPRSLLRFRSSCSIPRQSLAYQTLTQRGSCISVHYDACLDRSSRGVAVWQASACGYRGHAAGSVAAIQILRPARGSAGWFGVRENFAPKQPHPSAQKCLLSYQFDILNCAASNAHVIVMNAPFEVRVLAQRFSVSLRLRVGVTSSNNSESSLWQSWFVQIMVAELLDRRQTFGTRCPCPLHSLHARGCHV